MPGTPRLRSMTSAGELSISRLLKSLMWMVKSSLGIVTNGDTFLGGEDFDLRVIDYLADTFKRTVESI